MSNLTQPLNTEETEDEQTFEHRVPARGLEGAYGDDEPEYTLDMLIAINPDYEGTNEKCGAASPVPARQLEKTCSEKEPECKIEGKTNEGA